MAIEFKIPWFVGGIVPPGRLEEYVTLMYANGVQPTELSAHLFNGAGQAQPHQPPLLQLPAPTKKTRKAKAVRKSPKTARVGGVREYILRLLSKGSLLRSGIKESVRAHRGSADVKQIGTRLWELKRGGFATEENDIFALTDAGMKLVTETSTPARIKAEKSGVATNGNGYEPEKGSYADVVLRKLRRAHQQGRTVKLHTLYDLLQKRGKRGHGASVALNTLKQKGLVLQVGPGEYKFNPASSQEPANA